MGETLPWTVHMNIICVIVEIKQKIIALIRSKGGKANEYDENGRWVGRGNGDLNH